MHAWHTRARAFESHCSDVEMPLPATLPVSTLSMGRKDWADMDLSLLVGVSWQQMRLDLNRGNMKAHLAQRQQRRRERDARKDAGSVQESTTSALW